MSPGREAVDRLGAAFLSGDVTRVLAEFSPADDVLYAGSEVGEVAVGRDAVRCLLEGLLDRDERYSWQATDVHEVAVGPAVHVVAETELTVHTGGPDRWRPVEQVRYRVAGVLEREAGPGPDGPAHWRWRSCQGSEPVAAPPL